MKIVFASIPSQEHEISELVRHIYSNIFPIYFTDNEIQELERLKVLHTSGQYFKDISTLKEAFQVMTSLRTIISILECTDLNESYSNLFTRNSTNLSRLGLFFPFELEQFLEGKNIKKYMFSGYTKAANELLI
ncbi:DUF5365 family protein [Neobacillus sp. PS3-40]|uniref:DUF5365 family protein n=1 Tax=Neobacillus sp. PS3-40 TaxID=3070679 RepID=UPI0027E1E605|nr:DUF5365 family protein [Neobacillus sp. PS3-40]WML43180.1 DUF5365 family protein [Neobacillus sp. PS3-40]